MPARGVSGSDRKGCPNQSEIRKRDSLGRPHDTTQCSAKLFMRCGEAVEQVALCGPGMCDPIVAPPYLKSTLRYDSNPCVRAARPLHSHVGLCGRLGPCTLSFCGTGTASEVPLTD